MNLATFHQVLAPAGQRLLAEAAALADLRDDTLLRHLTALRRRTSPEMAAAVLETVLLRRRAAAKFHRADAMYFIREALEQATAEVVARHRAARFAGCNRVADLGCGIGGDTLALAAVAEEVTAVDRDPLRLTMAMENARAYGAAGQVRPVEADLATFAVDDYDGVFCDPARRTADGRRIHRIAEYQPPLAQLRVWQQQAAAFAVKVSPGIPVDEAAALGGDPEVEFISVAGELREAVLWFGPLRTIARRATVLPAGVSLASDAAPQPIPIAPPGRWLLEPDPAIYRAGLLAVLAEQLGAWGIDSTIAYLSADTRPAALFVRAWPVEEVLPFSVKGVRTWLRARAVGSVTVKKRGSPLDPQEFEQMLRLSGPEHRFVFLTRAADRPVAIICTGDGERGVGSGEPGVGSRAWG